MKEPDKKYDDFKKELEALIEKYGVEEYIFFCRIDGDQSLLRDYCSDNLYFNLAEVINDKITEILGNNIGETDLTSCTDPICDCKKLN